METYSLLEKSIVGLGALICGLVIIVFGDYISKRKDKGNSKKTNKIKNENYPVTVTDWIAFLGSETSINITIIFILITLTVGVIALIQSIGDTITSIILLIVTYVFFGFTYKYTKSKTKLAQELLDDIIEGKLTDSKMIRDKWIKEIKPKVRKILKDIL
jgi:hypothetical protein